MNNSNWMCYLASLVSLWGYGLTARAGSLDSPVAAEKTGEIPWSQIGARAQYKGDGLKVEATEQGALL